MTYREAVIKNLYEMADTMGVTATEAGNALLRDAGNSSLYRQVIEDYLAGLLQLEA